MTTLGKSPSDPRLDPLYRALIDHGPLTTAQAAVADGHSAMLTPRELGVAAHRERRCTKLSYDRRTNLWSYDDGPTSSSSLNEDPIAVDLRLRP